MVTEELDTGSLEIKSWKYWLDIVRNQDIVHGDIDVHIVIYWFKDQTRFLNTTSF